MNIDVSAEYVMTTTLPVYAGGRMVVSGDPHLATGEAMKTAPGDAVAGRLLSVVQPSAAGRGELKTLAGGPS